MEGVRSEVPPSYRRGDGSLYIGYPDTCMVQAVGVFNGLAGPGRVSDRGAVPHNRVSYFTRNVDLLMS